MASKTLAPKSPKGKVEAELEALPKEDWKAHKAQELSKVKLPKTFTYADTDITIEEGPRLHPNGVWVEVVVSAKRGGSDLVLDNPYQFENPPILRRLDTVHYEFDADLDVIPVGNTVEDLAGALMDIIGDAVRITSGSQ